MTVAMLLAILPLSFVALAAYIWWLITGRRLPGPLGGWLPPPAGMSAGFAPLRGRKLPADVVDAVRRLGTERDQGSTGIGPAA